MAQRIISWTLAGAGAAPIIGDALRSVAPIVDAWLVVNTTERPRGGHAARAEVDPDRVITETWIWQDDFGAARNAALDRAGWAYPGRPRFDWSLMLDDDERVICPDPAAFRAWLAALSPSIWVVCVHHNDGTHTRERFFRAGMPYRFQGRTHETLPCPENEQAIAPPDLIQWSELPKTREQLRAKFARDVAMLRVDLAANPQNGAAYYYIGVSLQSLAVYAREDGNESLACAHLEEAIEAYREHRRIDINSGRAWHEGTAFSCYRAAECYLALKQPDRALECAAAGLVLDAGIAELYWIASVASLHAGRVEQARAWAESAKIHAKGSASERRRKGFRIPRGLTVGPDEVLAAVRETGQ